MEYTENMLLTLESVAVFVLTVVFLWRRSYRKSTLPPGPIGLPVVGYIPFMGKNPQKTMAKLSQQYGSIYTLTLGSNTYVVLSKFDEIYEALMKKGSAFSGREAGTIIRTFGGHKGVIWRDFSPEYKRLRKFGITTLKGFGIGKRSMEDRVNEEVRHLSEVIMFQHGKPFDITSDLGNAAINIILSIASGNRIDYENETFKKMLSVMTRRYGTNNRQVQAIRFFPFLRHLPGYKAVYEETSAGVNFTKGVVKTTIEEHTQTFDSNDIRDFIDAFLKEMNEDGSDPFTREVLDTIIRDLFAAGSDTTTTTLRWCFLYLVKHQDFQKRLRDEIKTQCGTSGSITMGSRNKMNLTCSFIHEIQRYNPIVPLSIRKTTEEVSLRGYTFPKNTQILLNLWEVHRDSEAFVLPHEFHPERFIDEEGKFSKHIQVIPYSIGPRNCLGMHLAEMEVFILLTGILRNFEILEDPQYPLPPFNEGLHGLVYHPLPYKVSFIAE